ncbi:MAG: hypothetical protein GY834_11125, partial [Bacteroidetes bacterium]|nr:hypothetical protein [Bacteroidota bacterium]
MKKYLLRLLCVPIIFLHGLTAQATVVSVPGVNGITFDDAVPSVTLTADFQIFGLNVSPDGLTLKYETNVFSIYGNANVTVGTDVIAVSLSDEAAPGFIVNNAIVTQVIFGVSASFDLKSLSISPDNLTFAFDTQDEVFEMYGNVTSTFDGESIAVSLGDDGNPGLLVNNGVLEHINLGVTADFTLYGLEFSPDALTFEWDNSGGYFEMYGEATATFGGESIDIVMGDSDNPGMIVDGGSIKHINLGVTADFTLHGLEFSPDALTFEWDNTKSRFELYGSATMSLEGEDVIIDLGDTDVSGITIKDGTLKHIHISITESFSLKGLTVDANPIGMKWDGGLNYILYGDVLLSIDGESIEANIGTSGDPGIKIHNGVLKHINMGITADFDLKALSFSPNGLTFKWNKLGDYFEMYGEATTTFGEESIDVVMGDSDDPGIIVDGGNIEHINLGITADFTLNGLGFSPDALTFEWDHTKSRFELYGSATMSLEGEDVIIDLGDTDDPGIAIKGGTLKHINIAITESFSLKGLTIDANPIGMKWDGGQNYILYGDILLSIGGESVEADIGTSSDPGITIKNGNLESFAATINSDFKLGTLEVEVQETSVEMTGSKFHLTGILKATELWSIEIDLGQDGGLGLEIDVSGSHNAFLLDDFAIEVDNVGLGAIDIKELRVEFLNNTIHEAVAKVYFPPGWEIEADLLFKGNPAKLDDIDISWEADNIDAAIPVGETGIELVYLDGEIGNLTNGTITLDGHRIHGMYFNGSLGMTFGGPFALAGYSASLLYNLDEVNVTHSRLYMSASMLVGAYKHSGKWHSLLGDGNINADLRWNRYYKIKASVNIPSDPIVQGKFSAKVTSSGNFGALADVTLKVPESVPIIGGKRLGSVDGGLRYIHNNLGSSYAAGWASYKFIGTHHVGARYNFKSRKVSVIGSGTISNIKTEINNLKSSSENPWVKNVKSFKLPQRKTSMLVELDFGTLVDEAYLTVIGPDGFYNLKEIDITEIADTLAPLAELGDDFTTITNDSTATFLIVNHFPDYDDEHHVQTTLNPGSYDIMVSYMNTEGVDSVGINVNYFHPNPFGTITSAENGDGSIDLNLDYWAHEPDSSTIHLYVNTTDTAYNGELFGVVEFGLADENGYGGLEVNYISTQIPHGDSICFYFSIEGSNNVPYFSVITEPIEYIAPLHGTI